MYRSNYRLTRWRCFRTVFGDRCADHAQPVCHLVALFDFESIGALVDDNLELETKVVRLVRVAWLLQIGTLQIDEAGRHRFAFAVVVVEPTLFQREPSLLPSLDDTFVALLHHISRLWFNDNTGR